MPIFTEQPSSRQLTINELQPSFSQSLDTTVSSTFEDNSAMLAGKSLAIDKLNRDSTKISKKDADAMIDQAGLTGELKVNGDEYSRAGLTMLINGKTKNLRNSDINDRTNWNWLGTPIRGAAMLATSLADPVNAVTALIPVGGMIKPLAAIARNGVSVAARAGARAGMGAAEGVLTSIPTEGANYYFKNKMQEDYNSTDIMYGLAFGGVFGGGLGAISSGRYKSNNLANELVAPGQLSTTDMNKAKSNKNPVGIQLDDAKAVSGHDAIVINGDNVPFKYEVIEASNLNAATEKAPNQFRDRTNFTSDQQISEIARDMNFNLLHSSPSMSDGAPVLSQSGEVIAGNGRTLAIKKNYADGKLDKYHAPLMSKLDELGINNSDIANMKEPILIRRLQKEVDIEKAAISSNEQGAMRMSALEQSQVDAGRLNLGDFHTTDDGDLNIPTNKATIAKWISEFPVGQQAALRDTNGLLSSEGVTRLRNAFLFKAYGDSPILRRLVDSADLDSRNIATALIRVAPRVADAKDMISKKALHDLDISGDIEKAVTKFSELRDQGFSAKDYFNQEQMFDDGLDVNAKHILQYLGENSRSPRKLSDALINYYDELGKLGSPLQEQMFDVVTPSKQNLLNRAVSLVEDRDYELTEVAHPQTRDTALRYTAGIMEQDHRPMAAEAIIRNDDRVGGATEQDILDGVINSGKQENSYIADGVNDLEFVDKQVKEKLKELPRDGDNVTLIEGNLALEKEVDYLEQKLLSGKYSRKVDKEKVKPETTPAQHAENFRQQVDDWESGKYKPEQYINFGDTPQVFNLLGSTSDKFVIQAKVLDKVIKEKHGLHINTVKQLPEQLSNPVMVLKSRTIPDALVVLTELKDEDGKSIIAAVHLNKSAGRNLVVNKITSVYGRNNDVKFISENITEGNLVYLNKEKSHQWSTTKGLQLPEVVQSKDGFNSYNSIILNEDDLVKYSRGELNPTNIQAVSEAIRNSFGEDTQRIMDSGAVNVVKDASDIPTLAGVKHPQDVKAVYMPDGKVYVVANNVTPSEVKGLILHEVGVHANLENMLGADFYNKALGDLDKLLEDDDANVAFARAQVPSDTPEAHIREETMSYLVENNPELPLVKSILSKIKTWVLSKFPSLHGRWRLNADDFTTLATTALRNYATNAGTINRLNSGTLFSKLKERGAILLQRILEDDETINFDKPHGLYTTPAEFESPHFMLGSRKAIFELASDAKVLEVPDTTSRKFKTSRAHHPVETSVAINALADKFGDQEIQRLIKLSKSELINLMKEKYPSVQWERYYDNLEILEGYAGKLFKDEGYDALSYYKPGDQFSETVLLNRDKIKELPLQENTPEFKYSRGINPDQHLHLYREEMKAANEVLDSLEQWEGAIHASFHAVGNKDLLADSMKEILGKDFTGGDVKEMAKIVSRAFEREVSKGVDSIAAFEIATNKGIETFKRAALERKKEAISTAMIRGRMVKNQETFADKTKFMKSIMLGNSVTTENSRAHTAGRVADAMRLQAEGALMADLEKQSLTDWFSHNMQWQDTIRAMEALENKQETSHFAPESVKLAELISKHYDNGLINLNEAGASVGKAKGYFMNNRNAHGQVEINAAGKEQWVKDASETFDISLMADNMSVDEHTVLELLPKLFDAFVTGEHEHNSDSGFNVGEFLPRQAGSSSPNKIGNKVNKQRVIQFKNADAFVKYFEKYGSQEFAQSVYSTIGSTNHFAGLIKAAGVKHRENFHWIVDQLIDAAGSPSERKKLKDFKANIDDDVDFVDGSINQIGSIKGARIMSLLRITTRLAQLGGAVFSQFADLISVAAHMNVYGKGYLSSIPSTIGKIIGGVNDKEKREVLTSFGVFNRSLIAESYQLTGEYDKLGGSLAKMQNIFYKLNGQNWVTYRTKMAASDSFLAHMGSAAKDSYADLQVNIAHQLKGYGIFASDWELLRQSARKMKDGDHYLDASNLESIREKVMQHVFERDGVNDQKILTRLTDDYIKNLQHNYRQFIMDGIGRMVLEPSARSQRAARLGSASRAGTLQGEIWRSIAMYKTFNIELLQNTVAHSLYDDKRGKASVVMGMAKYALGAIAMGYMSTVMKDLMKGRTPRDPDKVTTWAAAAMQGGALPIMGDFLFGEFNRFGQSPVASIAGPVAGLAENVIRGTSQALHGDIQDSRNTLINTTLNNTPMINLFYTRQILNYFFLYNLQEWMNPGGLRRQERKLKQDNGQEYWLPPSTTRVGH